MVSGGHVKKIKMLLIVSLFFIIVSNILYFNYTFADFSKKTINIDIDKEFLTYDYIFSPNNEWIIFLPAGIGKEAIFMAINLVNGKYFYVETPEYFKADEVFDWKYAWESNCQAILFFEQGSYHVYFLLDVDNSKISIKKLENYNTREIELKSTIISREKNDLNCYRDLSRLKNEHPEFDFKTKGKELNIIYNNSLIAKYGTKSSSMGLQIPNLDMISISPDDSYAFYVISWVDKNNCWNTGPNYLYLLDLKTKQVILIDEKYGADSPEIRFWTDNGKKFIYRTGVEGWEYIPFNIISFDKSKD